MARQGSAGDPDYVDVQDRAARALGRVSTGVGNSVGDAGATAAAPVANTTVATLGDLPDGVYDVEVTAYQVGTVDANRTNMELRNGAVTVADLLSTGIASVVRFPRVTLAGTDVLLVRTGAVAGGAGAVYVAQITATRVE